MKYYCALFDDGELLSRSTAGRTYTHAWKADCLNSTGKEYTTCGFSGSLVLAQKAINSAAPPAWGCRLVKGHVAVAVEVTASDYRQAKKEA